MRRVRAIAACAALLLAGAACADVASARTDNRTKPIVFVHGLDAFGDAGVDCAATWNTMANRLGQFGHTGTKFTVKYYWGDTNCSGALDAYGSHSTHFPRTDAHQAGSHDMDGDIRHLGYHLAWMIYNKWSASGVTIDAVGHSMGGLILRYAISRVQAGDSAFPPSLLIEDVVTLGTPHQGSGWASGCTWAYECVQMENGSAFVTSLAQNPQGAGGTDWTLVSSYDDGIVSEGSGVGMTAAHKVSYLGSMNIGHSDYMNDTSDVRDADVEYNDNGGTWYSWLDAPHAVRWSDFGLLYGTW
jgi:Palmitoyl protein thioesterase